MPLHLFVHGAGQPQLREGREKAGMEHQGHQEPIGENDKRKKQVKFLDHLFFLSAPIVHS